MEKIMCLSKDGIEIAPLLDDDGRVAYLGQKALSPKGMSWSLNGKQITLMFDSWIDFYPTPELDGLVVIFPKDGINPFPHPDNAAVYNADGSLRFQLKAPQPLSRHYPGYIPTAEEIAGRPAQGFWQVGWRTNDFGQICDWLTPYLMWADIGLHYDVYERRYFDPATGQFDLEHYSTARL